MSRRAVRWQPEALRPTDVPCVDLYHRLREERLRQSLAIRRAKTRIVWAGVGLIFGVGWAVRDYSTLVPQLVQAKREAVAAQAQRDGAVQGRQAVEARNARLTFWKAEQNRLGAWADFTVAVAVSAPPSLFLDQLSVDNSDGTERFVIEGRAETMDSFLAFQTRLQKTGFFSAFALTEVGSEKVRGRTLWRFRVTAEGAGALTGPASPASATPGAQPAPGSASRTGGVQ